MNDEKVGVFVVDKGDYLLRPGEGRALFPVITCVSTKDHIVQQFKKMFGLSVRIKKPGVVYTCALPCGVNLKSATFVAELLQDRPLKLNEPYSHHWMWLSLDQVEEEFDASQINSTLMHLILQCELDTKGQEFYEEPSFKRKMSSICDLRQDSFSETQKAAIKCAEFGRKELEYLFQYFTYLCWPNQGLDIRAFTENCPIWKSKGMPFHPQHLFNAFDTEQEGCLSFQSFVTGLALMQTQLKYTIEEGKYNCGLSRAKFIFSYFSRLREGDSSPTLQLDDIRRMDEHTKTPKKLETLWKATITFKMDEVSFRNAVGDLTLRGTSQLLKLEQPSFPYIYCIFPARAKTIPSPLSTSHPHANPSKSSQPLERTVPLKCVEQRVEKDVKEIITIKSLPRVAYKSSSSLAGKKRVCPNRADDCCMPPISNIHVNYLGMATEGNDCQIKESKHAIELLKALQFFSKTFYTDKDGVKKCMNWGNVPLKGLAACIFAVCQSLMQQLSQSPAKCQNISHPAYVLGNLNGNFLGLLQLERNLWPMGIKFSPCNVVFLGDYCGLTGFGFELVVYLFAQKLLAPNKVIILKSNSELETNRRHNFRMECCEKLGHFFGNEVYKILMQVFDLMPQTAIIGKEIFCAHSGIAHPKVLKETNTQDDLSHILNPKSLAHFSNNIPASNSDSNFDEFGFGHRDGSQGKIFSSLAVSSFLKKFSFRRIVVSSNDHSRAEANVGLKKMDDAPLFTLNSSFVAESETMHKMTVMETSSDNLRVLSLSCHIHEKEPISKKKNLDFRV